MSMYNFIVYLTYYSVNVKHSSLIKPTENGGFLVYDEFFRSCKHIYYSTNRVII